MIDDLSKGRTPRFVVLAALKPTKEEASDEAFARSVIAGEPWAERELFERYAAMVHRALRRGLGPGRDIDDLMQEVFLTVFDRVKTLRDPSALRSFIYSVTIRRARWEMRRRQARSRDSLEALQLVESDRATQADPESRDLLTLVQKILDAMKDKYRLAFVMHRIEDQPILQVAQALEVSVTTAGRWVKHAVRQIEKEIRRDERLAGLLETERAR
jgi:RNA polymerase sigma-70 factor, ECF subfamily